MMTEESARRLVKSAVGILAEIAATRDDHFDPETMMGTALAEAADATFSTYEDGPEQFLRGLSEQLIAHADQLNREAAWEARQRST